ncbi:MAG: FAD-dependent oxidoreductase [Acidobacteriota bacterium]|nr:FAD-dependent oxidoreductase [Acidobacteriota bacterium]
MSGHGRHLVVVGAGAFGGWTALWLRRGGARVTLLDAWEPGNSRSSSGDETRILRAVYGPDAIYVELVARSLVLWRESEAEWGERILHPTGALWMFSGDDGYLRSSLPALQASGFAIAELSSGEARERFPQFDFTGVRTLYHEPAAGYLSARRACRAVAAALVARGGEYRQQSVRPGPVRHGRMERLLLASGEGLEADGYVFACGAWLAGLFPDLLGGRILPSRQEVFYFGTPAGSARFGQESCPVWMDFGERIFYGIPGNDGRGFKVADDTRGQPFDPTSGERTPTAASLAEARTHLARRLPDLAAAPLLESRVCAYENSLDGHYLIDRHPEAGNAWLVGGGSGHGFKLSPALGEHLAGVILSGAPLLPQFGLARPGLAIAGTTLSGTQFSTTL